MRKRFVLAHSLIGIGLVLVCASAGQAQTTHFTVEGDASGEWFGFRVRACGDVDADGFQDLIVVGAKPGFSGFVVSVLSGQDGRTLYEFSDPATSYGAAASGAGDVNDDGFDDFMISDYRYTEAPDISGRVWVHSGFDGSVLLDLKEAGHGGEFGYDLAPAGDVDGDGRDDLIIGTPNGFSPAGIRDAVVVHSGRDGSLIHELIEPYESGDPIFGRGVASAGDVDADGVPDIIGMGWWFCEFANTSYSIVYSGATGEQLHFIGGVCTNGYVLSSTGVGDVNADGHDDFAVGRAGTFSGYQGGQFVVYSGLDASVLHAILYDDKSQRGDGLGRAVAAAGDINHDGYADILVSAPQDPNQVLFAGDGPGYAQVFSGRDGRVLVTVTGDSDEDLFGYSVAAADFDGDGFTDIAVSAPRNDRNGLDTGAVRCVSLYQAWTDIGGSLAGAAGPPRLHMSGQLSPGGSITAGLSHGPAFATAALVVGHELLYRPRSGGVLVPRPDLVLPLGLDGHGAASLTMPSLSSQLGPELFWFQAWMEDPTGPEGLTATQAIVGAQRRRP